MKDNTSLNQILTELQQLNEKVDTITGDVSGLKTNQEQMSEKLGNMEGKMISVDGRLSTLEVSQKTTDLKIDNIQNTVTRLEDNLARLEGKLFEFEENNMSQHEYTHTLVTQAFSRLSNLQQQVQSFTQANFAR